VKIVSDTNFFINARSTDACLRDAIQEIIKAHNDGAIKLHVSRHTLAELEVKKPDAAYNLAKTLPVLPHWPIGTWPEQVGSWEQLEGTWCNAKQNDSIQEELTKLATSGNDIRDRGAFLDALHAKADAFVTSDKHLVGSVPAKRISERFGLRIVSPSELLKILRQIRPREG
jgi:predicted nucleic acid-binding protein